MKGRLVVWLVLAFAVAVEGVALWVADHNLANEASALLCIILRLPSGSVQAVHAGLHPLGRLRLSGVDINFKGSSISVGEVTIHVDPTQALHGRLRPHFLSASALNFRSPFIQASAAHAEVLLKQGQIRVITHDVLFLQFAGLRQSATIGDLSLDLLRGQPQRLAAREVRVGPISGVDLFLLRRGDELLAHGALPGGLIDASLLGSGLQVHLDLQGVPLPSVALPGLDLKQAQVGGALEVYIESSSPRLITLTRPKVVRLRGQVHLGGASLQHSILAGRPLREVSFAVSGELLAEQHGSSLKVRTPVLRLTLGKASMDLAGEISLDEQSYQAHLELSLTQVDCGHLLAAMPVGFLPGLAGMELSGTLGGALWLNIDSQKLPEVDVVSTLDNGCKVLAEPQHADPIRLLDDTLAVERTGEDGQPHRIPLGEKAQGTLPFQPLATLPWSVVRAFLVAEDNLFYGHHGFDTSMIIRALGIDLQEGQATRGASTITQQVVKNLWLAQERSVSRKLEEAVLTWRVEQVVSKKRILEIYLNLVELGSGIYGIASGADHYFGVPATELTVEQAVQLAALLPAPRRGMDAAWSKRWREIQTRYPPRPGAAARACRLRLQ